MAEITAASLRRVLISASCDYNVFISVLDVQSVEHLYVC